MSKKTIEKNLKEALLEDGELVDALFEYELAEHAGEYLESKKKDGDKYFFALTEHTNDVAMLLIDEFDNVHRNQVARELLKSLWHDAYKSNMRKLIPQIAQELNSGLLFTAGVKVMKNPKSFWRKS